MKNTSKILLADLGIVSALTVVLGPRFFKNYQRKTGTANAYMIQNVATKKVIRPYNAGIKDGNRIIQYTPENWECTTWQFIRLAEQEFILKNLYTQKSFQSLAEPQEGIALFQAPLDATKPQRWEFIRDDVKKKYKIRLKATDLYITPSSNGVNAQLILQKETGSDNQKWTLKAQTPIV
ncbi:MAG TPA: RICIN domain-containing protein [Tetragenococcus sp.]|nr:RICIN domain-containing protein [Tetragenococcus sp.]